MQDMRARSRHIAKCKLQRQQLFMHVLMSTFPATLTFHRFSHCCVMCLFFAVVDQTEQELKEVELKVEAADHAVQEAEVLLQQKHQEKERVQAKLEESGHQMQENQDIVIKTTERVKRLKVSCCCDQHARYL